MKDAPIRSFSAGGMAFEARAYDAGGLGRVSAMTAEGMGGRMRMESLIFSAARPAERFQEGRAGGRPRI